MFFPLFFVAAFATTQCLSLSIKTPYGSFKNLKELAVKIQEELGDDLDELTLMKMLDASTKIPSGIMAGNFFDFGNFDECYDMEVAKYCLGLPVEDAIKSGAFGKNLTQRTVFNAIHPAPMLVALGPRYAGFHFAVCIPATLPASSVPHGDLWEFREEFCYSKTTAPKIAAWGIVTIVIIGLFLAIALVSTIYDIFLFYTKQSAAHELFIAFSFLTNGQKIFTPSTNPDQLLCLNGIKAISMMWVLLGHVYLSAMNAPVLNFSDIQEWQNKYRNMIINGGTVSVDTFFTVAGLVTVYTYLKSQDKGVKFNIILFYIHRYLRLTPALVITAMVYTNILRLLGTGPLWNIVDIELGHHCKDQWWSLLLYVTNFNQSDFCVPQSWYLYVDMQLFVFSPIVLIALSKWPKQGLGLLGALIVAGVAVPFAMGYVYNLSSMFTDRQTFMKIYYSKAYTRFGPYVLGMLLGYYIYDIKKNGLKIKLKPAVVGLLWVVSLVGLVACVFSVKDAEINGADKITSAFILGFNRNGWAVCVGLVVFLCVAGYGAPVDGFLSLPIFQVITKLSYSMYLVHYALIIVRYSAMKNSFKFSNLVLMHNFWGDFMFTLALSLILCLLFESPIIIIEKYLFGGFVKTSKRAKV